MTGLPHQPTPPTRCSRAWVGVDLAFGCLPLFLVAAATARVIGLPMIYLGQAGLLYGALATLVLWFVPEGLPGRGLGAANRVTLGRALLVLPVVALVLHPDQLTDVARWWIIGVSTIALVLDSIDGWVARRRGGSAFGARFDMELDAVLILALATLVWLTGRVGAWVLLIGLLRYLFVMAGWIWSALRAALPSSVWRQTVCVIQGVALLVCLGPIVPAATAGVLAAIALAVLIQSFGSDVWWLLRTSTWAPSPPPL